MTPSACFSRRLFLQSTAAAIAAGPLCATASQNSADDLTGRIYKTLKIGMVKVPGPLAAKFRAAKEAGFDGIELDSPGNNIEEVRRAIQETGLPVDGSVCSAHWQVRHTDPDAKVRAQALQNLRDALRETHAVGGHTVLLVVGHGKDGPEREIWRRSVDNIRQAIPLAAELGVAIAIENVWNEFLYDHAGGADQTADKFSQYVDEFHSPWVGMQFDIGNHWKYGNAASWIRALDRRVVKLDAKGFSRQNNSFTDIGEGDIDWADVRRALKDINFHGWAAAEVGGGDLERLQKVAAQMDRVFALRPAAG